ncbi:MAG: hypothetical protein HYV23_04770 [Deltaproteobacteria bacterium]|nr:hypothetical protein [Deltaproteobacteria bacterium]
MKKNLITIFLFVGAVTLNLSMLSQASCAGVQDRQINEAAIEAARHASAVAHYNGYEVKSGSGNDSQHGFGVKCAFGVEGPGVHLDFNFKAAAIESPPEKQALQAIPTAVSAVMSADSVPQDRPPKPLA